MLYKKWVLGKGGTTLLTEPGLTSYSPSPACGRGLGRGWRHKETAQTLRLRISTLTLASPASGRGVVVAIRFLKSVVSTPLIRSHRPRLHIRQKFLRLPTNMSLFSRTYLNFFYSFGKISRASLKLANTVPKKCLNLTGRICGA